MRSGRGPRVDLRQPAGWRPTRARLRDGTRAARHGRLLATHVVSLRSFFRPPGPADRVRRARHFMQQGEPNEARLELEGLTDPEAAAVRAEALQWLVRLNLEEALLRKANGEHSAAREAVSRMRLFGATAEQLSQLGWLKATGETKD